MMIEDTTGLGFISVFKEPNQILHSLLTCDIWLPKQIYTRKDFDQYTELFAKISQILAPGRELKVK